MNDKMSPGGQKMGRDMEKRANWKKNALKRFEFYFHREIDKTELEYFEKIPNKRQYLISLIKKDMEEKKSAS